MMEEWISQLYKSKGGFATKSLENRRNAMVDDRKNKRNSFLRNLRNIPEHMSPLVVPKIDELPQNNPEVDRKSRRLLLLEKWKQEKEKNKMEAKKKQKPIFKVFHVQPNNDLNGIFTHLKGKKIQLHAGKTVETPSVDKSTLIRESSNRKTPNFASTTSRKGNEKFGKSTNIRSTDNASHTKNLFVLPKTKKNKDNSSNDVLTKTKSPKKMNTLISKPGPSNEITPTYRGQALKSRSLKKIQANMHKDVFRVTPKNPSNKKAKTLRSESSFITGNTAASSSGTSARTTQLDQSSQQKSLRKGKTVGHQDELSASEASSTENIMKRKKSSSKKINTGSYTELITINDSSNVELIELQSPTNNVIINTSSSNQSAGSSSSEMCERRTPVGQSSKRKALRKSLLQVEPTASETQKSPRIINITKARKSSSKKFKTLSRNVKLNSPNVALVELQSPMQRGKMNTPLSNENLGTSTEIPHRMTPIEQSSKRKSLRKSQINLLQVESSASETEITPGIIKITKAGKSPSKKIKTSRSPAKFSAINDSPNVALVKLQSPTKRIKINTPLSTSASSGMTPIGQSSKRKSLRRAHTDVLQVESGASETEVTPGIVKIAKARKSSPKKVETLISHAELFLINDSPYKINTPLSNQNSGTFSEKSERTPIDQSSKRKSLRKTQTNVLQDELSASEATLENIGIVKERKSSSKELISITNASNVELLELISPKKGFTVSTPLSKKSPGPSSDIPVKITRKSLQNDENNKMYEDKIVHSPPTDELDQSTLCNNDYTLTVESLINSPQSKSLKISFCKTNLENMNSSSTTPNEKNDENKEQMFGTNALEGPIFNLSQLDSRSSSHNVIHQEENIDTSFSNSRRKSGKNSAQRTSLRTPRNAVKMDMTPRNLDDDSMEMIKNTSTKFLRRSSRRHVGVNESMINGVNEDSEFDSKNMPSVSLKSQEKKTRKSIINSPKAEWKLLLNDSFKENVTPNNLSIKKRRSSRKSSAKDAYSSVDSDVFLTPTMNLSDKVFFTPKDENNEHVVYISPFVTSSRGKHSARKEYEKRKSNGGFETSMSGTTDPRSPQAAAAYFTKLVNNEISKIQGMCNIWANYKQNGNLTEDASGLIDMTIGQSNLLISKKFKQFQGLIEKCKMNNDSEMKITCEDLHGFWDMIYKQVQDLNKRFDNLEDMKTNNWLEEAPKKKKAKRGPKRKKRGATKGAPVASTLLKEAILAARRERALLPKSLNNSITMLIPEKIATPGKAALSDKGQLSTPARGILKTNTTKSERKTVVFQDLRFSLGDGENRSTPTFARRGTPLPARRSERLSVGRSKLNFD